MSDKPPVKRGPGRPHYVPTDEQRAICRAMAAGAVDHVYIAQYFGISRNTLERKFKEELRSGKGLVGARLTMTAMQKALGGDRVMLMFVLKTQYGWRETNGHQWLGKNGDPISFDSLDDSSLDQVLAALKTAVGTATRGSGEN